MRLITTKTQNNLTVAKFFFSIVIPSYNREKFLAIALNSVLNQSFSDYEVIIVDDGSTDNTKETIKKFCHEKIKYYYQKNQGPAAARNLGVKKSSGKYICFLDSDDRFRKDKLLISFQEIIKNPKFKVFHTQEIWYKNKKILPQKKYHKKPSGFIFKLALRQCSISISTAIIKRDLFNDIGFFDQKMLACEDYDFWIRASLKYPVYLINQPLTLKEGGHNSQQSKKYPHLDTFRIYSLEKILETCKLSFGQKKEILFCLKNYCLIYLNGAKKRNKTKEVKKYQKILEKYGLLA